jgi:hypothetical protein
MGKGLRSPILKVREAQLQDLRCDRAGVRYRAPEMLTSRFAARSMGAKE